MGIQHQLEHIRYRAAEHSHKQLVRAVIKLEIYFLRIQRNEAQQIYVAAVLGSHVVHAVAVLSAEVLLVKVEEYSGAQLCAFVEWGVILGILESVIASYPCA